MTEIGAEFLGELRFGRRLTRRSQILASGAAIWIGVGLLRSGEMVGELGSWGPVVTLLAGLLIGLTLLSALELLGGSGEQGGTYSLIYETHGGLIGTIAGWAVLGGFATLLAAFLRAAASELTVAMPVLQVPLAWVGLFLFIVLAVLQLFQVSFRRLTLWHGVLAALVLLGVALLALLPEFDLSRLTAPAPVFQPGYSRALAQLAILYAGLDVVLGSRRQVQRQEQRLPSALLLLLVLGMLALAAFIGALTLLPGSAARTSDVLAAAAPTPAARRLVHLVSGAAFALAAHVALTTTVHQIYRMSRHGSLPRGIRRLRRPLPMPPWIFVVAAAVTVPLVVGAPLRWTVEASAAFFLVGMLLLNTANLRSHSAEPDRRRLLVVPFYPLVPSIGIATGGVLLFSIEPNALAGAGAWLLLGLIAYAVYGRRHEAEAQEGVSVFGGERPRDQLDDVYRILVPVDPAEESRLPLWLALALARQLDGELVPLQVIRVPDPLASEQGRRLARQRNEHLRHFTQAVSDAGVPVYPITRLSRRVGEGIVETATEESCNLILMTWSIPEAAPLGGMGPVLGDVVRTAPCDLAVVAFPPRGFGADGSDPADGEEAPFHAERILVPTAGGPHAPLAFRLAVLLAQEYDARISAVYVLGEEASEAQVEEGEARIRASVERMRELWASQAPAVAAEGDGAPNEVEIEPEIVRAPGVAEGIAEASEEQDLVFIGASEEGLIDQVLFGDLTRQVAAACAAPVVMVKRYRGLPRFWLRRAWEALFRALPTLEAEERVEVYVRVRRDARPDVDFFIMMGLSAVIATLGLMQDNVAVIIGSMLVAPLFTPIVAMSLGIVQGDIRLLRVAFESALQGVALAIGLAFLVARASPLREATPQILQRTAPNLLDLAVALASGAAGAYAVSRKDVAAALPGVAIAAALVPPLGVVGFGLATGELSTAGGSALLVTTNLIAITLAGVITLLLLGFRPARRARRAARLRAGLLASVALLIAITVPLAFLFRQSIRDSRTREVIQTTLDQQIGQLQGFDLDEFDFDLQDSTYRIVVKVSGEQGFTLAEATELSRSLQEALDAPVHLEVDTVLERSVEAGAP